MADDPFADYKSPPKADDPFADYKSPAKMPAALTYDPNDPNASWGSWALSKLHNAAVGGNLWHKAFQDSSTFGGLDKAQSMLPGSPSLEDLRGQTEEARKQIGPVGNLTADIAGYAMVPGGLKVGEGLAGLAGGGKLAQIGGSAIEGAGASGLGTLGHGGSWEDAGSSALVGGALGGVTGAIPGGHSTRPVTPSTAELQGTASGLYKPLESKVYQSPDVAAALDKVGANVSQGLQSKISSNLSDQIERINRIVAKGGGTTASDIADFRSSLQAASRGKPDQAIVGQYLTELENRVGPNMATKIKKAARSSNIAKTSGEIEGWLAAPGEAPKAIKGALKDNPDFYKAQPGLFDALTKIGSKADEPGWMRQVANHIATTAAGSAIGEGYDYLTGDHRGIIGGAIAGATMPKIKGYIRTGPVKGGLLAAQHLNATGQALPTGAFSPAWQQAIGNLARQWGYGAGAAGNIKEEGSY
jgi:hypothetical protein